MPSPREPEAAWPERLAAYRAQLDCRFPQVGEVFEACLVDALRVLSRRWRQRLPRLRALSRPHGAWRRTGAGLPRRSGRRPPQSSAKTRLPAINHGPSSDLEIAEWQGDHPLPADLAAVARRLPSREQMQHYLDLTLDLMERTSGSIHGIHKTFASPGLPDFLRAGATAAQRA
jgi:nitric oxide reductase NorD protein